MIGQIVYNLEDYAGTGGLVSTDKNDLNSVIYSVDYEDKTKYADARVEIIGTNCLANFGITTITKLGIQAPPGTQFVYGVIEKDSDALIGQTIMVGRTGVYELDGDLNNVSAISFLEPTAYALDPSLSKQFLEKGRAGMESARLKFDQWFNDHKSQLDTAISTETQSDFWSDYEEKHDEYLKNYEEARSWYVQGLNGIYVPDGTRELRNVIIDFIYTTEPEAKV